MINSNEQSQLMNLHEIYLEIWMAENVHRMKSEENVDIFFICRQFCIIACNEMKEGLN